ncbi:LD-carboxypeptidase [Luteitalea sp. TBR-22]|uniref:S66 peptidase family protein n=1 Tax=Luteitalea sp. TBR-22 TaxID=2802971 RepID=UPI001AFAAFBF|nr:LD-carboxypeptidase [Luteitalea sp. TBR-22]
MPTRPFLRPRALRRGDRIALLALASRPRTQDVAAGAEELRRLGFEPVLSSLPQGGAPYVAGSAVERASALRAHLHDSRIAAVMALRGGYGSAQVLPHLDLADVRAARKLIIGYSDITSLLDTFTGHAGLVTVHGPMLEGRLALGPTAYDRDGFLRVVTQPEPFGAVAADGAHVVRPGAACGILRGGTLTQIAALLGTPWAWSAAEDTLLFLDDVNERPYRLDRMLWQLRHAGVLDHVRGVIVNELPGCDEPGGTVTAVDAVREALTDFDGPVVAGIRSGHTAGAMLTLPFGVQATLEARDEPRLVIDEPAVT